MFVKGSMMMFLCDEVFMKGSVIMFFILFLVLRVRPATT